MSAQITGTPTPVGSFAEPVAPELDAAPAPLHRTTLPAVSMGLALDERVGRVVVVAAEDNLTKGTAGAAVQCLNLALGLPETLGLPATGLAP